MGTIDLEAKRIDLKEQVRLAGNYFKTSVESGGLQGITPWISLETVRSLLESIGDVDLAYFPNTPFFGNIAVVKSPEASRQILHEYDFTHLQPGKFQRRMFGLTRGNFILDTQDRETWKGERHQASKVFSPSRLNEDSHRLNGIVANSIVQFKEMDANIAVSTRVRGMVASAMMGAYLGEMLPNDQALKMVQSYEKFFKISAVSILGGTHIPVVNNHFKTSLQEYYSVTASHVAQHMHGNIAGQTPFQRELLEDVPTEDLYKAVDRVKALMAGMNSITNATQWLLYMLGSNRDLQHKVRSQVAAKKVDWSSGLLEEMSRRYPIALYVVRDVKQEFNVSDISLPSGTTIIFSHLSFKPDVQQEKKSMPYFDLQFGNGPRVCIGKHLSKLLLTDIVKEFVGKTDDILVLNHPTPVLGPVTLRPSEPFKINFDWKKQT